MLILLFNFNNSIIQLKLFLILYRGCLVKTGKYRPGDEAKETAEGKKPDFVFDSFAHCVERVLSDMNTT